MQKLKFPILMYGPTFIQGNVPSSRFKYCLESVVNDGFFRGMKILSSDGQTYLVTGVKKKSKSFAPWYNWFNKDKLIDVELILEHLGEPPIDDLRKEIEDYFETHADWVRRYSEEPGNNRFLKRIRTVNDLTQSDLLYGDSLYPD